MFVEATFTLTGSLKIRLYGYEVSVAIGIKQEREVPEHAIICWYELLERDSTVTE